MKTHINDGYNAGPTAFFDAVGGKSKEWKEVIENVSQKHIENKIPQIKWEGQVKQRYVNNFYNVEEFNRPRIDNSKLIIPLHVDRSKYKTHEELYKTIKDWWIELKQRSPKTIENRIRHARSMANHSVYPVDWIKFEPEQILNQLLYKLNTEYKQKQQEQGNPTYGITQINNLWKTVRTFSQAYGIDISYWGWSPPSPPEPQVKIVPRPKTVNKLIHHWYTNDRYENALIRTLLTVGFHAGVRPEELLILKVKDVYLDDGYIFIREQKKKYRERQIWIDDPVLISRQQNSLKNWIEIWRPKRADKKISKDFLFIQKDGKPFPSEDALRMYLSPDFQGFIGYKP